jgi:hypothetical protein
MHTMHDSCVCICGELDSCIPLLRSCSILFNGLLFARAAEASAVVAAAGVVLACCFTKVAVPQL